MRPLFVRVLVGAVVAAGVSFGTPAWSACHAFTISVSPSSVTEGASTTVTVERDGDVGPSSVRVRTVDKTAKAGSDYAGVSNRTVEFTSGTTRSFVVATTNDTAAEGAETFQVELVPGSGGGCAANPDFHYGGPATVTIKANDRALPSTPPPTTAAPRTTAPVTRPPVTLTPTAKPATTPPPTRTASPAPARSPIPTTAPPTTGATATTTPAVAPDSASPAAAGTDSGGGLPMGAIVLVALAVAGGLGYAGFRMLRA